LGDKDLFQTVKTLVGTNNLSQSQLEQVVAQILAESDLDGDQRLSYVPPSLRLDVASGSLFPSMVC
jgi:hypothetical protein